jgi:hypothetical protein
MADIVEIVHRLTFDVAGKGLDEAIRKLKEQASGIDELKRKEADLARQMQTANKLSVNDMQRLGNERAKIKRLIEQETSALQKNFGANKQLQTALTQEIGIIQRLETQLKSLQDARRAATNQADINRYNSQISGVQGQIQGALGGGRMGQIKGSILSGLGVGVGFGLLSQGVSEIRDFVREASQLAKETEGVKIAFDRLNNPDLLGNLRAATRGTVSDLDLMKQAVNFQNFGLPVEKLADAFEFARQRARDTGQSVDYLVNSITTGIARKSPLILDNLGINAKTVRDRFKETGDFAEAAFQIIAEESAKAGEQLDTFADKQEQVKAKIDNAKAAAGGFWNTIIAGSLDAADAILGFFGQTDSFSADFARQQKLIEDVLKQSTENNLSTVEKYNREYESLDEMGRRAIENQAHNSYNELARLQQSFFRNGLTTAGEALQGQLNQYIDFFSKIKSLQGNKKIGFNQFAPSELLGLSQSELKELRKSGTDELDDLVLANDTKRINEIKSRVAQIDKALERFSLTVKTTKAKVKKEQVKPDFLFGEMKADEYEEELKKYADAADRQMKRVDEVIVRMMDNMRKGGATGFPDSLADDIKADIVQNSGLFVSDEKMVEINQSITDTKNKQQADKDRKAQIEKNKELVKAYVDGYQTIVDAAINAFSLINQAQLLSVDTEISIREKRVDAAIRLAEKGNSELLNVEREALETAQRERERIARRQIAINAALQVSNSLVAVARAASEGGGYGSIALIAAVVAALASGYGAVQSLNTDTTPAFRDGVVNFKGKGNGTSDSNHVRISNGESVITATGTERNKRVLEMINAGHRIEIPTYNTPVIQRGDKVDTKKLEKKFDRMIGAYEQTGMNVVTRLDANGFYQKSERNVYKNKQRYTR